MKDKMLTRDFDAIVEDALRSLPLEPAPPGLKANVMENIHDLPVRLRFRLHFIDYALALFAALMAGGVLLMSRWLPPQFELYLRLEALYWMQSIAYEPFVPLLYLVSSAVLVAGLSVVAVILITLRPSARPRTS